MIVPKWVKWEYNCVECTVPIDPFGNKKSPNRVFAPCACCCCCEEHAKGRTICPKCHSHINTALELFQVSCFTYSIEDLREDISIYPPMVRIGTIPYDMICTNIKYGNKWERCNIEDIFVYHKDSTHVRITKDIAQDIINMLTPNLLELQKRRKQFFRK